MEILDTMTPVWQGDTVFEETVLPLREDGETVSKLLYPISEILSVTSYDRKIIYTEGKDFLVRDGNFVVPQDTSMPIMPMSVYNFSEKPEGLSFACKNGGYLLFTEGTPIVDRQFRVTYRHEPSDLYTPHRIKGKIPRFKQKLTNGEPVTVAFFGDSISVGCNSSKILGIEPFIEAWDVLVCNKIEKNYGSKVHRINHAQGGTTCGWGAEHASELYKGDKIDLAVINFGMNDGATLPLETYIKNLRSIADTFKAECYDPDIMFLEPSQPNPLADEAPYHRERAPLLYHLAEEYGNTAAVAPMNILHNRILGRKPYSDMTANNINHPNDFLVGLYGQTVYFTLEP